MSEVQFRRYSPDDAAAVWTLHEWAMGAAGTDPEDVPGTDDLRDVESAYLDVGGDFVVGIGDTTTGARLTSALRDPIEEAAPVADGASASPDSGRRPLRTTDGPVVAIGGFMPSEEGHEDERTVPGAAELHRMRVAPPLQGEGFGRQLLHELEARARGAGFERLVATTAVRQRKAMRFYPAAGYREVDRSSMGAYDLVHFEKDLPAAESEQ